MGRPGGILEVIDAMWHMESDMRTWVDGLCAASLRASGEGAGTIGYFVDTDQTTPLEHKMWGGDEHFLAVPRAKHELVQPSDMLRAYGTGTRVGLASQLFVDENGPFLNPAIFDEFHRIGICDGLAMMVPTAPGERFVLGIGVPSLRGGDSHLSKWHGLVTRWGGLAQQIERALGLRYALSRGEERVVADFDESGRGDFAIPEAREALVEQAKRMEAGRNALSDSESDNHAQTWIDIVGGRYSIVRYRQHGGRLRFLAIENSLDDIPYRRLSEIERTFIERVGIGDSNKAIAIDYNMHPSSVANILKRAMMKVGLSKRSHVASIRNALAKDVEFDPYKLLRLDVVEQSYRRPSELTDAENHVVDMVIGGSSNSQIASARGASNRTVANQLASVYRKLSVNSRTELIASLQKAS